MALARIHDMLEGEIQPQPVPEFYGEWRALPFRLAQSLQTKGALGL